jgi:xanthine/uracil permease
MGLDANLAILMSGVCTILFLLIVNGKVPSYLGTSASFVAAAAAIRSGGGNSGSVTGAILVAGVVLALVGVLIHLIGAAALRRVLPPVVSGAVVMLIGFNLAPVVAGTYWPQDQGVAIITMLFAIVAAVAFRGFWSRIAVFLALIFGYVLSFLLDRTAGMITSKTGAGQVTTHFRIDWSGVSSAHWFGLPTFHAPQFHLNFILLALPGVIALIAENTGHVRAVAEMTGDNLDPYMGRAIFADGLGTALASSVGGSPTTTYAENIGVMAATPGGVLGGITVVLYGMIGLLGAKIWLENRVNFANSINLVPIAAGLIAGIGGVTMGFGSSFSLSGIALGSIVAIAGFHLARMLAPAALQETLYLPEQTSVAPGRPGRTGGQKVPSGQPARRGSGPARQRR